jgi:transposase
MLQAFSAGIEISVMACKPETFWKEARRLQAWRLKQRGWPQRQIAEALGVSEAAVSQWVTRGRDGGPHALRHCPAAGAPRRLAAVQAAVMRPWSQGPIEGQINRLKMLKRQIFGRARLDLLARRFLLAA